MRPRGSCLSAAAALVAVVTLGCSSPPPRGEKPTLVLSAPGGVVDPGGDLMGRLARDFNLSIEGPYIIEDGELIWDRACAPEGD